MTHKPPAHPDDAKWFEVVEFTSLWDERVYFSVRRGPWWLCNHFSGAHWRTRSLKRARRVRDRLNRGLERRRAKAATSRTVQ